jgi:hypothetical protein
MYVYCAILRDVCYYIFHNVVCLAARNTIAMLKSPSARKYLGDWKSGSLWSFLSRLVPLKRFKVNKTSCNPRRCIAVGAATI